MAQFQYQTVAAFTWSKAPDFTQCKQMPLGYIMVMSSFQKCMNDRVVKCVLDRNSVHFSSIALFMHYSVFISSMEYVSQQKKI